MFSIKTKSIKLLNEDAEKRIIITLLCSTFHILYGSFTKKNVKTKYLDSVLTG